MTREQLIEMLWEEYKSSEYVDVVDEPSFSDAINTALDTQARGCESVYREESLTMHPGYYNGDMAYSIIKADPEVTP